MGRSTMSIALLVLVLFSLSSAMVWAGSDPSVCNLVQSSFGNCITYLTGAEAQVDPTCCTGVNAVNDLTRASLHPRGTCECLKKEMAGAGATTNSNRIADLAEDCHATIGFTIPTGPDFDCIGL